VPLTGQLAPVQLPKLLEPLVGASYRRFALSLEEPVVILLSCNQYNIWMHICATVTPFYKAEPFMHL